VLAAVGLAMSAALLTVSGIAPAQAASGPATAARGGSTSGIPPIKHVWLIILENKSFDATFTGLNNNTYLWKPSRPRARC
jgi:phospholipase C